VAAHPDLTTPQARFLCYYARDGVFWRLIGRNHRPLGRSARCFPDLPEALSAIALVVTHALTATYELTSQSGRSWSWSMQVDDIEWARSEAGYGRRIECLAGVSRFEAMAPCAALCASLLPVRATGPTRFGGPSPVARSPGLPPAVHLGLRG